MAGLEQLAAQALSSSNGEEDLEKQIQEALACPCVGKCKKTHSSFYFLSPLPLPLFHFDSHRNLYFLSLQLIYGMVLVGLPL